MGGGKGGGKRGLMIQGGKIGKAWGRGMIWIYWRGNLWGNLNVASSLRQTFRSRLEKLYFFQTLDKYQGSGFNVKDSA